MCIALRLRHLRPRLGRHISASSSSHARALALAANSSERASFSCGDSQILSFFQSERAPPLAVTLRRHSNSATQQLGNSATRALALARAFTSDHGPQINCRAVLKVPQMSDGIGSTIVGAFEKLRDTILSEPASQGDPVSSNAASVLDAIDHAIEVVSVSSRDSILAKTKPALAALIETYDEALRRPDWQPLTDRSRGSFVDEVGTFLAWVTDPHLRSALDAVRIAVNRATPAAYDLAKEASSPLASAKAWLPEVQRAWPMDDVRIEEARLVVVMCTFVTHGIIREILPRDAFRMGVLRAAEELASGRPFADCDGNPVAISVCVRAWFQFLRLIKFNAVFARSGARLSTRDPSQLGDGNRLGFGAFTISIKMDIDQWLNTPYLQTVFGGARGDLLIAMLSSVGIVATSSIGTDVINTGGGSNMRRQSTRAWFAIVGASIACTTASIVAAL